MRWGIEHDAGLTLYQVLDALQDLLRGWTGTCTCGRPLPHHPQKTTTRTNLTKHYQMASCSVVQRLTRAY